jgi:hypothetical protein
MSIAVAVAATGALQVYRDVGPDQTVAEPLPLDVFMLIKPG